MIPVAPDDNINYFSYSTILSYKNHGLSSFIWTLSVLPDLGKVKMKINFVKACKNFFKLTYLKFIKLKKPTTPAHSEQEAYVVFPP
jgi:hypothetical protein